MKQYRGLIGKIRKVVNKSVSFDNVKCYSFQNKNSKRIKFWNLNKNQIDNLDDVIKNIKIELGDKIISCRIHCSYPYKSLVIYLKKD